jgi:ubiquinone/menaquinone biosynthesis C-methylase UbiE
MQLAAGTRILEVGAGPATLWRQNLERVPPGCEITLTDFSAGMVEEARSNLRGTYPHFSIRQANAMALPFEDEGYDVVMAHFMLYHVPDIPRGLSEMRRVLKPGGRFFAGTTGQAHLREIPDIVHRFDPAITYDASRIVASFSLENGAEQLAAFFDDIRLHIYEDSLLVTEPEPLVAYVASMMTFGAEFTGERLQEFGEFVKAEFAAKGPLRIQKTQGMFEAIRPTGA